MNQVVLIELDVHPLADLFLMMPDDELAELAEDIRVNGLRQPIIRDKKGMLLDGRNRLAACKIAGVEPRFERFKGTDPEAFIWSLSASVSDAGHANVHFGCASVQLCSISRFRPKINIVLQARRVHRRCAGRVYPN